MAARLLVGAVAGAFRRGGVRRARARLAGTVEATRADPDSVANHGIDEVTSHYATFIDGLPARRVLIGHSFGGLIAEKLLGADRSHSLTIDAGWPEVADACLAWLTKQGL